MAQSKPDHLSTVIMQLEDIATRIAAAELSEGKTAAQARRFNEAGRVDDLGETLHRIATAWRNQRPV